MKTEYLHYFHLYFVHCKVNNHTNYHTQSTSLEYVDHKYGYMDAEPKFQKFHTLIFGTWTATHNMKPPSQTSETWVQRLGRHNAVQLIYNTNYTETTRKKIMFIVYCLLYT